MTGPPDPNHDLPEPIETILPLFVGRFAPRDTVFYCTFSRLPQSKPVLIHVPFGWGPVMDPVGGVLITSHARIDCPRIGPAAVLQAARDGRYGFRLADETEGSDRCPTTPPPPAVPRDGADLDLDATEDHCRQGWHVAPATALGLIAVVREREAEVERLKGILDDAWNASGLLCAEMTGKPDQAYEEPSDLVDQIIELAERASIHDEAENEADELRAEVERLRARCEYVIREWTRPESRDDVTAFLADWDRKYSAAVACKGEDADG